MSDKIHDYRQDKSSDGVVLVVRTGNRYGGAHEGEFVRVDERETRNPSTISACYSVEEREELERRRREAEERAAARPKTGLGASVAAALEKASRDAARAAGEAAAQEEDASIALAAQKAAEDARREAEERVARSGKKRKAQAPKDSEGVPDFGQSRED